MFCVIIVKHFTLDAQVHISYKVEKIIFTPILQFLVFFIFILFI